MTEQSPREIIAAALHPFIASMVNHALPNVTLDDAADDVLAALHEAGIVFCSEQVGWAKSINWIPRWSLQAVHAQDSTHSYFDEGHDTPVYVPVEEAS